MTRCNRSLLLLAPVMAALWMASVSESVYAQNIQGRTVGCGFCGHPEKYPWHYSSCRYYGLGLGSGGSGGGSSPALENAVSQLGFALGAELGKALFGDPAKNAERAELLRQQQAQLAEENRLRRIADERRREELFQHLIGTLKLSGVATLALKGFDGDRGELTLKGIDLGQSQNDNPLGLKLGDGEEDEGLRPQGTSFFGLGGGAGSQAPPEPTNDPMVVDLRNLERSAFLVQSVDTASPEDAPLLLNEALKAANGDRSFIGSVPAGDTMPPIDEKGLLAFQKANLDYAKARDLRMKGIEAFNLAQRRRELADRVAEAARVDLEKAMTKKMREATLKKKHELMAEAFAAVKAEEEAWAKAKAEVEAARTRDYKAREDVVRVLRATAAGKDPATFHPPIASLPSLDEKTWMQYQEKMIASRNELDRQNSDVRKLLKDLKIPVPTVYQQVHEGVILGYGTDAGDAHSLMTTARSPFTGKTYLEMNEAVEKAMPRGIDEVGGAMAVSFGTPKTGTAGQEVTELARVAGDHLTSGQVSLQTPQGKEAVTALTGKEFDRLLAHSNGATIAEALIQEDLIKVNELNIVGGDRSLLNGHAFQKLLDTGKVKRVVVWINLNDPVVGITALDQLKLTDRTKDAVEHIARKMTGELAGGDSRVEYHFMWGQGKTGTFEPHYLETAYYPNIANEIGSPWAFSQKNLEK